MYYIYVYSIFNHIRSLIMPVYNSTYSCSECDGWTTKRGTTNCDYDVERAWDHQHVGDDGACCCCRLLLAPPPLCELLLVDVVLVLDDEHVDGLLLCDGCVTAVAVVGPVMMVRCGMGRNWDGMRGVSWYVLLLLLLPPLLLPVDDSSRLRGEADASNVGVFEMLCECC